MVGTVVDNLEGKDVGISVGDDFGINDVGKLVGIDVGDFVGTMVGFVDG